MVAVPRDPFEARRDVAESQDDGSDSGSEAINDERKDDEGYKVMDVNEYNEYMGGEFQERGLENGEETAIISRHYDQRDAPIQEIVGRRKEECVIVVFQDVEGSMGEPCCVGSFVQPSVFCEWQLSSQNPGLKIRITTAPGVFPKREAICCVALAAIKRSYDDNGNLKVHCSMRFGHDLAIREDVNWTPSVQELTDHAYQDSLMQVHLEMWQDIATAPRFETGPQPCATSWRGLSLRELSGIDANHDAQEGPYGAFEYMVTLFSRSKDWRIYRRWDPENLGSAWVLKSWIAKSLFLTAKYEEMWHYQLQLNNEQPFQSVFASDTKLDKLEPPRNLVIDWLIETDEKGIAIGQPKAHRVKPFSVSRLTTVYSSPGVMSLQLRLAIERNRQCHIQILRFRFETGRFDIIGTFHTHQERPGLYIVELRVPHDPLLNLDHSVRVKSGTKLEMAVDPSEFSVLGEGWVGNEPVLLQGVVVEDIFGFDAEVTAIFEGPSLEPFVELADGVELKGDPASTDRHQATIKEIEEGVQRTKGVDFSPLVLRAPPSIFETDSLARQMTDALRGLVTGVANAFNLDNDQTEALNNAAESSSGVTAICGPSGTGKSRNVAAIGYAHIRVGKQPGGERHRPVLACAPINVAVDTLMSHFLAGTNHGTFDDDNLIIVRYRGSLPREDLTLANGLDPVDRAEPHARYGFYVQRQNKIDEWAVSEAHVMKGTAQTYIDLKARTYASDGGRELSKSAASELKSQLGDAEDLLTSYFLQHAVDIVFCTNSSSAQGMLHQWYRPKILLSDDLAICSIPDGATPIGAFKEHIEHWTLAGDYPEQKPVLASKYFNEWADILLQSLFQWTVEPRIDNSFFVELGAQYRMDHHLEPVPKPDVKKKTRRGLKKKDKA